VNGPLRPATASCECTPSRSVNVLEVYTTDSRYAVGEDVTLQVGFRVDGRELTDIVQDAGAGQHARAAASDLLPPNSALWGLPSVDWMDDGGVVLLVCGCGEIGCDPLAARITVDGDTVTWSDFANEQEGECYPQLGPFVFDTSQYEAAVAAVGGPGRAGGAA